jgi:hypothetical protein
MPMQRAKRLQISGIAIDQCMLHTVMPPHWLGHIMAAAAAAQHAQQQNQNAAAVTRHPLMHAVFITVIRFSNLIMTPVPRDTQAAQLQSRSAKNPKTGSNDNT